MLRPYLRPIAAIATLTALAAYASIMLRGPQGLSALAEKHRQIRALEEENANLRHEVDSRKQHVKRLETDPGAQELELERSGFLHEHDTQFKVGGEKIAPPPAGR